MTFSMQESFKASGKETPIMLCLVLWLVDLKLHQNKGALLLKKLFQQPGSDIHVSLSFSHMSCKTGNDAGLFLFSDKGKSKREDG